MKHFYQKLHSELETPAAERPFGSGWISGVAALCGSLSALAIVLCLLFPALFTTPELRAHYDGIPFHLILDILLLLSFGMALLNLMLRRSHILGYTAIVLVLSTTLIGEFAGNALASSSRIFFGLDWFFLNMLFSGALFIPLERIFARLPDQRLFRQEWREDLFYYFVSSMMVQLLTFLTLWPSQEIVGHTQWETLRASIAAQPFLLQIVEIMVLTDIMQYMVHRAFHRVPFLWRFHSVHHSAQSLDWMAGARMHFIEIFVLRSFTVLPMMVLGYAPAAVQTYILLVYLYSTLIHANLRWSPKWLSSFLVTPRYHHWHHGIEREAIDVNFAIHFPLLDRLFGTYYLPEEKWPGGYGIKGHPVPKGYAAQFLHPFRRR